VDEAWFRSNRAPRGDRACRGLERQGIDLQVGHPPVARSAGIESGEQTGAVEILGRDKAFPDRPSARVGIVARAQRQALCRRWQEAGGTRRLEAILGEHVNRQKGMQTRSVLRHAVAA